MNKLLLTFSVLVGLLLAACDKNDILPDTQMRWTHEIKTPENVTFEGCTPDLVHRYYFKANGPEGDIVLTCTNYDTLNPISGHSYTYDCGWAMLRVEGNQLKIHFPRQISDIPDAYEEITVSANDGNRTAETIICLSRSFKGDESENPGETLPDEAKFKLTMSGFQAFMHLDTALPAPLDLITFRIKDINDRYTPVDFPDFTQYYDSIVWCADEFPDTFRIFEKDEKESATEKHFTAQWSSHFFRSGTIKTHLKGYYDGEVRYETSLKVNLYQRDFLGIEWGPVVLQNPKNMTSYCLLDTAYEYQVNDIIAIEDCPLSKIIPVNHKLLSHSEYMSEAAQAIRTLMETNIGKGQNAAGKEHLFKCLPQKEVEAELYWENKTCRMMMVHQIPDNPDEISKEEYYLHIEPKR